VEILIDTLSYPGVDGKIHELFFRIVGASEVAGFPNFGGCVLRGDDKSVLVIGFQFLDFKIEAGIGGIPILYSNAIDFHWVFAVDNDFAIFGSGLFADFPKQGSTFELDELRDLNVESERVGMVVASLFGADSDLLALHSDAAADVEMSVKLAGFTRSVGFLFQRGNGATAGSLGFGDGDY